VHSKGQSSQEGRQQERGTHELEIVERRKNQDTERERASKGHSRTGECRARDQSGRKEGERAGGTHGLESAERGTNQDMENKRTGKGHLRTDEEQIRIRKKSGTSERHALSGECRARYKSGHGNRASEGHSRPRE
jgi:hypothetical protein